MIGRSSALNATSIPNAMSTSVTAPTAAWSLSLSRFIAAPVPAPCRPLPRRSLAPLRHRGAGHGDQREVHGDPQVRHADSPAHAAEVVVVPTAVARHAVDRLDLVRQAGQ